MARTVLNKLFTVAHLVENNRYKKVMSDHYLMITIYIDAVFLRHRHDVILLHLVLGLTGRVVKQDS